MKNFILRTIYATFIIFGITWIFLLFGINILSMSILFLIPIGGILFGLILGTLSESGLKKDEIIYEKKYTIIIVIYSCILLFALTYFDYITCYVNDKMEINHFFNGEHISNYTYYDVPMTFENYFNMEFIDSTMSISIRGNRSDPIDTGMTGWGMVIYILNYLAISYVSYRIMEKLKTTPLCIDCKKYYKETEIDRFLEGASEQSILDELLDEITNENVYKAKNANAKEYAYSIRTLFCPMCKKGAVSLYAHTHSEKGDKNVLVKTYIATPEQISLMNGISYKQENIEKTSPEENQVLNDVRLISVDDSEECESLIDSPTSIYCNKCGTLLPKDGIFCPRCGEKLKENSVVEKKDIPMEISDEVVKQLRNLKSLYDDGILTKEEFQDKKERILGK